MGVCKVIYDGKTLIDLSEDTVTAQDLAEGVTAHDASGEIITGTNSGGIDTTDATANASEILAGKTAYVNEEKLTGTMLNRGSVNGEISNVNQSITIQEGYHSGSGTVVIASSEKAKLVAENIKSGVNILGVTGTHEGNVDLSGDTVTADKLVAGVTAHYASGEQITGSMTDRSGTSGEINNVAGSFTIPQGYHDGQGNVSISESEQAKIVPENIKAGVEILGVTGTASGGGGTDTSDATASASDILEGQTAYVDGEKVTGTMINRGKVTGSMSYANDVFAISQGYHDGTGSVTIDSAEQAKIIPENIKSGVRILGVDGSLSGGVDTSSDTVTAARMLAGTTAHDANGNQITGTMPNNGAVSGTISSKTGSYSIPAGYHNGSGAVAISTTEQNKIVSGNIKSGTTILGISGSSSVVDVSGDTVTASNLLSGETAHRANGSQITGSMTNRGAYNISVTSASGTYSIPAGYHNGNGSVVISSSEQEKLIASNIRSGVSILGVYGSLDEGSDTSNDTVRPEYLLGGYTAHNSNGEQITGTITYYDYHDSGEITDENTSYTIPQGYHDGSSAVYIDSQNLQSSNIKSGVTILGVTGENYIVDVSNDTVQPEYLREGETAHKLNGEAITGTMKVHDYHYIDPQITDDALTYNIEEGYYDGGSSVRINSDNLQSSNIKAGTTILGVTGEDYIVDVHNDSVQPEYLLSGETAHKSNGEQITGSMPVHSHYDIDPQITDDSLTYHIAEGYYDGDSYVRINSDNLRSENIKAGVTILGTTGEDYIVDVSNDTIDAEYLQAGYTAHKSNGEAIIGTMPYYSHYDIDPQITDDSLTYNIRWGCYDGDSSVRINSNNLRSENIKAGTTILGVTGEDYIVDVHNDSIRPEYLLAGETAHNSNGEAITGTMTYHDYHDMSARITNDNLSYHIERGYYDGESSVYLDSATLFSENIKSGVTILGVTGDSSIVDVRDDSIIPSALLETYTAHDREGKVITGTMPYYSHYDIDPQITEDTITYRSESSHD